MKAFGGPRRDAASRILRSQDDNGGILKLWLGMAFYLAFIGVLDYAFLFQGGADMPPVGWAVLGLFTFFGVGGAVICVHRTLGWFKYGSILLYLDAPARTGARLAAQFTLPGKLRGARSLKVSLSCIARERRRPDNGGSHFVSEAMVWSESRSLVIHWVGNSGKVQVQFEIPIACPETEHPPGGVMQENRAYHRWELVIAAEVPGIDLSRTFDLPVARGSPPLSAAPVEIAPRRAVPASHSTADAPVMAKVPVSASGRAPLMIQSAEIPASWKRSVRVVAAIAGTVLLLWFFGLDGFVRSLIGMHGAAGQRNQWPAAVAGPFEMKPDQFQQALRLFASEVKLERHGEEVRVRVGKLRLVKVNSSEPVTYVELGAYLLHMPQGGYSRELAKWREVDHRGTIAAGRSEESLGPIDFSFGSGGSQCLDGNCWLKLYAFVPQVSRYENTAPGRFLFSPTTELAGKGAPPTHWESWFERAQQAAFAGRVSEAKTAFDEAIGFVSQKHGEDSAVMAFILWRQTELLRRQLKPGDEDRLLSRAAAILEPLDDKTIAAQIGPDWGGTSPAQEFVPRRLAEIRFAQGRHEDSLALYRHALAVTQRLGALSVYTRQLKNAENRLGLARNLCRLRRMDEAAGELRLADAAAREAARQMESRWQQLFSGMKAGEDRVHRPNYQREQAAVAERAARIESNRTQLQAGNCAD